MFTLYTCNYRQFTPRMGTAVQISIGSPRWPLRYALDFKLSELMPTWPMLKMPYDNYVELYRAHLEDVGVEYLGARFQTIATATGEPRLVMLCFEDLSKPELWCHRRMFADFWHEMTGQLVVEVAPRGGAAAGWDRA